MKKFNWWKDFPSWGHISLIILFAVVSVYIMLFNTQAATVDFLLVGSKFSDIENDLVSSTVTVQSAGDRTTYSFMKTDQDLTNISVKDNIIEVVEIYTNFNSPEDAFIFFEELVIHVTTQEKCKLVRAYTSTLEFKKNSTCVRVEQLPTAFGWLVKYTAYLD